MSTCSRAGAGGGGGGAAGDPAASRSPTSSSPSPSPAALLAALDAVDEPSWDAESRARRAEVRSRATPTVRRSESISSVLEAALPLLPRASPVSVDEDPGEAGGGRPEAEREAAAAARAWCSRSSRACLSWARRWRFSFISARRRSDMARWWWWCSRRVDGLKEMRTREGVGASSKVAGEGCAQVGWSIRAARVVLEWQLGGRGCGGRES